MKLAQIEKEAATLTIGEMKRLVRSLQSTISDHDDEGDESARPKERDAVATKSKKRGMALKQEMVKCGKKNCQCANGRLHGPYWYEYWNEGGKTRSRYIGKHLPSNGEGSGHHHMHAGATPARNSPHK